MSVLVSCLIFLIWLIKKFEQFVYDIDAVFFDSNNPNVKFTYVLLSYKCRIVRLTKHQC